MAAAATAGGDRFGSMFELAERPPSGTPDADALARVFEIRSETAKCVVGKELSHKYGNIGSQDARPPLIADLTDAK